MESKKALIVITSVSKFPTLNRPTGFWFTEVSHFYEVLTQSGWQVDFVSPRGGLVPIEPKSLDGANMNQNDWKTLDDQVFRNKLGATLKPSQVDVKNYKVIYFAGGHGTVWDFYQSAQIHQLAAKIYENGGIVAAVCHGPVAIINLKLSNGEYLIKGKKLTAFSNEQQILVELDKHVPFSLQDELKNKGSHYERGAVWANHTVEDNRLITGQNPASCKTAAQLVVNYQW